LKATIESALKQVKSKLYIIKSEKLKVYKAKDRLNQFINHIENEYVDTFYKYRRDGFKDLRYNHELI